MAGSPVLYQCGDSVGVASIVIGGPVGNNPRVVRAARQRMRLGYFVSDYAITNLRFKATKGPVGSNPRAVRSCSALVREQSGSNSGCWQGGLGVTDQ